MRLALMSLLGALAAVPAMAQGYHPPAAEAWSAARHEWHRAHRAEDIARWRAANGDHEGAERAHAWAERHRFLAHRDARIARSEWGGWGSWGWRR